MYKITLHMHILKMELQDSWYDFLKREIVFSLQSKVIMIKKVISI